ncbi:glycosyl hydrolase family 18 protein [Cetobacterium sp.]|uniref:glycosyl hydrolase family 18 protein n=1 Tax=Cetobacterium sp. TaxID=2071632 RepID=UPI003F2E6FB9
MNTLEIQSIKSHFSNVLNHYNNLKKRFIESSDELESLNIQLIELKNKVNSLTMESSIIYFFEVKETLSTVEKNIFDLDIEVETPEPPITPEPPVEPEVIVPTVGNVELTIKDKKATVVSKSVSDSQGRITLVTYNLKTSVRNTIEQRTATNPSTPVNFNSILTAGDYIVEAIFSYTGSQSLEQISKSSNKVTIEEDVILPPPSTDNIATLKLSSSQSWGNGFSANLELVSHTAQNYGGTWELSFDSPASSLSQWQINSSKVGNRIVVTSGTDWSGAANFNLGPNGSFKIDGINGNGAGFDNKIAANATLNGKSISLIINGEVIGEGTTPNPEPNPEPETPKVSFPDKLPILGATSVEAIYLSGDKTTVLGTVSIPNTNIHAQYAVYVNGFKTTLKPVELTRRSSILNVNLAVSSLPLLTGTNEVQLVFAGVGTSSITYYTTNILTLIKESTGTSKKSLIGYWSSWGGNAGQTSYIDLEATPSEYDTIVVSFIEHANDYLTPQFNPELSGKVTRAEFAQKVARMKAKGHNVIIAVGGQNGVFHLGSDSDKAIFKNGVIRIIEEFGFNGFDIDLEGQSALNGTKYAVDAIKEIIEYFRAKDPQFVYSMAPEVAYLISDGFGTLYSDLIKATKHLITTIHPQFYNAPGTGIYPFDGSGTPVMCNDQAKFIPAFAEALMKGHDGPAWGNEYASLFPIGPIPEEMLAIGLPAGVGAAGTGATNDMSSFTNAWRELERKGYTKIKGFMTWSIDWDEYHNWQFKNAIAPLIK